MAYSLLIQGFNAYVVRDDAIPEAQLGKQKRSEYNEEAIQKKLKLFRYLNLFSSPLNSGLGSNGIVVQFRYFGICLGGAQMAHQKSANNQEAMAWR